ncbi:trypsin-like peptidase domain-containing protein [Salinarimonas soli]
MTNPPNGRARWMGAVALAALLTGGALGSGVVVPFQPARAEVLSLDKPAAVPSFADVVERVKPAVVSVRVKTKAVAAADTGERGGRFGMPDLPDDHPLAELFRRFEGQGRGGPNGPGMGPRRGPAQPGMSQGSGFFISGDGYLVTNNHVVDNAAEVQVVMDDGRTLDAKVVGTDPKTDLALVKVNEGGDFPYVRLAPEKGRVGDWVVAIGNPFGLGGTVTAGIVSAQHRDIGSGPYDDYMQIDAAVNRGNSGGPTFNLKGEVVGVNTAIFSPSGGNVGIAFAIPAHVVQQVVTELKTNGSVTRGFIGVQIQPVTKEIAEAIGLKEARGALVAEAQKGTPAEKAGVRSGDVILSVNGEAIKDARELSRKVASIAPGTKVPLKVLRQGREQTLDLEVGRLSGA